MERLAGGADGDRLAVAVHDDLLDRGVEHALAGGDGASRLDRRRAGDRRGRGLGAGRDDELVERLVALAARVAHGEPACREVDREDLTAGAHVDPALAMLARAAADEA